MLLLKIKALLEEGTLSTQKVSSLLQGVSSEEELDTLIESEIKTSPKEFREKWAAYGISKTKHDVWKAIIRDHYHSMVVSALGKNLKVSTDTILNNISDLDDVFNAVASELASGVLTLPITISAVLNSATRKVYSNNRPKYQRAFSSKVKDLEADQVTVDYTKSSTKRVVTDGLAALRNIKQPEVKVLLSDIYKTSEFYVKQSNGFQGIEKYSIYDSFLRAHFRESMKDFNATYKGKLLVIPERYSDVKFIRWDELMHAAYVNFISKGISADNVVDFTNFVFNVSKASTQTNAVPVFNTNELGFAELGNFGNSFTFKNSTEAKNNFSTFIKACIALAKLYRYLTEAGVSPYAIHPDLFSAEFEDPGNKFQNLAEVVEYSSTYLEVRGKYGFNEARAVLKAVHGNDKGGSSLLPTPTINYVNENRAAFKIDDIIRSVDLVLTPGGEQSHSTMHFIHEGTRLNLFEFVDAIHRGYNPLYCIYNGENIMWDAYRYEDEVIDEDAMALNLKPLFGEEANELSQFHLGSGQLDKIRELSKGELKEFLRDLWYEDGEENLNIIRAIHDFLLDFRGFLDKIETHRDGLVITEIEYALAIYRNELFQPLQDVVRPDERTYNISNSRDVVMDAMFAILSKYHKPLTKKYLVKFLLGKYNNITYSSFVRSLVTNTFNQITRCFFSAKAEMYNLSDIGTPIRLPQHVLQHALENVSPMTESQLQAFKIFENVRRDSQSYLVNELGELLQVTYIDNKAGALHAMGVYVFTDGTTKPWVGE